MQKILTKFVTYYRLGVTNLIYVFIYRLAIKTGYFARQLPIKQLNPNNQSIDFFTVQSLKTNNNIQKIKQHYGFGWLNIDNTQLPNWQASITSGVQVKHNKKHWSKIGDFDLDIGDIKTVWELSRFNWLLVFSVNYLATQDQKILRTINSWLSDWCYHNPINQGVNWKCGQEAAIRVLHLTSASYLLNQSKQPSTALTELIYYHLQRIAPTLHYAMAQDNNHGTSEASALFIGSLVLEQQPNFAHLNDVNRWKVAGRYWLENRANKLIAEDGAFSQHSLNYHRLMLDTLTLAEFFRQHFQQKKFSERFYQQAKKACQWLYTLVEPNTGRAPLLGHNDGAQLLPVTNCDYLDYRPSLQWAFKLFFKQAPYPAQTNYQQLMTLFSLSQNNSWSAPQLNKGELSSSYHSLSQQQVRGYIRTPNLKFRPATCDALHLDLWINKENLFVGTGSYSYNCEPNLQDYFTSVRSHNTVQFDQLEQMPRLSRFLFSNWIKTSVQRPSNSSLSAFYLNHYHHSHQRQVILSNHKVTITDTISGFSHSATLRWHLPQKQWHLNGNILTDNQFTITITSKQHIKKIALVDGFQSRYYLKKEQIPVLEITVCQPSTVTTLVSWQ